MAGTDVDDDNNARRLAGIAVTADFKCKTCVMGTIKTTPPLVDTI
jgi:hypothetical protein